MSNSKKLQLIQEATAAFPGTPVNSAIWYYLRNRYGEDGSVAGLIARYLRDSRWAYSFDGVDDRGQLQFRAINPDGDIDIEWRSGPTVSFATSRTIISQTLTTSPTAQEFFIFVSTGAGVVLRVGGASIGINNVSYKPNTKYRVRLQGTTLQCWVNDELASTQSFTRGTTREPSAVTSIGSTVNSFLYLGELYDVRINGVLWPMNDRNQAIQLPSPSGLGPELITQSVLENPSSPGTQWTYLGGGRWQLIGDGSNSSLVFINALVQPEAGFLEFEIESISGTLMCTQSTAAVPFTFNTPGVKRYYYTSKGPLNEQTVVFKRQTGVVNCIIKNISFKPLWVASAAELVTNGGFSSSAGWGLGPSSAISGGVLQVTNTTGTNNNSRTVATSNTKAYQLTYRVTAISSGAVRVLVYGNGVHYIGPDRTVADTYTELVIFNQPAGSAINTINVQAGHTGPTTCTVDDVSLKELDSLCNPMTLINTNPDRWQEVQP